MTIRPVTPGADDALLTPRELAAAFQLDFAPPKTRPRRRSKRAGALLVLLLLGVGAAALFYLRPDIRDQATRRSSTAIASAKGYWQKWRGDSNDRVVAPPPSPRPQPSSPSGSSNKPGKAAAEALTGPATPSSSKTIATPAPATRPQPIVIAPPKPPAPPQDLGSLDDEEKPPASAPARPTESVRAVEAPAPKGAPAAASNPGDDTADDASPTIASSPDTAIAAAATTQSALAQQSLPLSGPRVPIAADETGKPAFTTTTRPAATAPQPGPRPSATPTAPAADPKAQETAAALKEARRLLGAALDAEGNQDYVEAVRCYEAIKRLPVDARTMGVDLRLDRARKLAR